MIQVVANGATRQCVKAARSQPRLMTPSACQDWARPSRDPVNRYHPASYHASALKWTRHTRARTLSTPPGVATDEAARCEKNINNPSPWARIAASPTSADPTLALSPHLSPHYVHQWLADAAADVLMCVMPWQSMR
jgi:hypothetical protein